MTDLDPARAEVAEVVGEAFTPVETGGVIFIGVLSLLISGLLALLLGALVDEHRLSAPGLGLTAMLEALSAGLTTGGAAILLKPNRLRLVAVGGSILLALANLATLGASGGGLMLVRTLAGIPEGLLLWITIGLISRTVTPERWAGVLFTAMPVSQLAVALALSGYVLPHFGANGAYGVLAAASLLGVPAAMFIPRRYGPMPGSGGKTAGSPPPRGWIALLATLAVTGSLAAVGVYLAPLAQQAGLSVSVARTAISASLALQIVGGALAVWLAGRVRYITVFWGTAAVFLATWASYAVSAPAWLFIGMSGLAGLCGMLVGPFYVPMTIEADPSRRAALQSGGVQLLAGALGPLLASLVVGARDAHGVLVLGAVLLLTGVAIVTGLHRSAASAATRASLQRGPQPVGR